MTDHASGWPLSLDCGKYLVRNVTIEEYARNSLSSEFVNALLRKYHMALELLPAKPDTRIADL